MIAYLDNSATTRPHARVIAKMADCMSAGYFNPSSIYAPAVDAFREVRACRELLLSNVGGADCDAVFTSGGTEANNLAILGAAERMRDLKLVAYTAAEHPSVKAACESLAARGIEARAIGVNVLGEPDYEALERALDDGARLVCAMQVNNETGAVNDIKIIRELTEGRALLHVDGVQGFMRAPFDMSLCDMYTVSAHKIHGPKGVGALVFRKGVRFAPRSFGGSQESGLRCGTENTPGIAGFYEAMRVMRDISTRDLMKNKLYLIKRLREYVPAIEINGAPPEISAPHIVNVSFPGVRAEVMLHALESRGVYVSTGAACSSKKRKVSAVLTAMGIPAARAESALRFSLSPFTAREELDYAAESAGELYEELKKYHRR